MKKTNNPKHKNQSYITEYSKANYKCIATKFRVDSEEEMELYTFVKVYGPKAFMRDAYQLMKEKATEDMMEEEKIKTNCLHGIFKKWGVR